MMPDQQPKYTDEEANGIFSVLASIWNQKAQEIAQLRAQLAEATANNAELLRQFEIVKTAARDMSIERDRLFQEYNSLQRQYSAELEQERARNLDLVRKLANPMVPNPPLLVNARAVNLDDVIAEIELERSSCENESEYGHAGGLQTALEILRRHQAATRTEGELRSSHQRQGDSPMTLREKLDNLSLYGPRAEYLVPEQVQELISDHERELVSRIEAYFASLNPTMFINCVKKDVLAIIQRQAVKENLTTQPDTKREDRPARCALEILAERLHVRANSIWAEYGKENVIGNVLHIVADEIDAGGK